MSDNVYYVNFIGSGSGLVLNFLAWGSARERAPLGPYPLKHEVLAPIGPRLEMQVAIALGLYTLLMGLCYAADAEYWTETKTEGYRPKIVGAGPRVSGNVVGITGLARLDILSMVRYKVALVALQESSPSRPFLDSNVEQGIEEFMLNFSCQTRSPVRGEKNAPSVQFIRAALDPQKGDPYCFEGWDTRQCVQFDAVGIKYLNEHFDELLSECRLNIAALMACYVLQRVNHHHVVPSGNAIDAFT